MMDEPSTPRRFFSIRFLLLFFLIAITSACSRDEKLPSPKSSASRGGSASSESQPASAAADPVANTPRWHVTNYETEVNVKTLAIEGDYLWMGLPNGIIRYNTRT